jgi:D-alanyl-D-alanine-carboxypeptidase/D-alanyl-D-alanine-endopeptidase
MTAAPNKPLRRLKRVRPRRRHARSVARGLVVAMAMLVIAPALRAAAPPDRAAVAEVVGPMVEAERCHGLVVAVVTPAGDAVYGFGRVGDGDRAPDGDTLYEIASVTKTFTGLLLAEMVERGEVKLDTPVQSLLPPEVKLTPREGRPITLLDLTTHRSGLPRLPGNMKFADPTSPYADYTVEQLHGFLSRYRLPREPGAAYEYSNLGVGLLGHVLALKAGTTYEAVLTQRVLAPLKMTDTAVTLSADQKRRLAPGHDAGGNPAPNWDMPALAGAGALRSTGNDMLKFLRANVSPAGSPLERAIVASHRPHASAEQVNDVALGWHVWKDGSVVWHNGQTGGYHAYVGFAPGRRVGVALLADTAIGEVDAAGVALLRRLIKSAEAVK